MAERLLLVGMMGAGKSSVGRLAAAALGWSFRDVDDEIERAAGSSVAALFSDRGEPAFRELETEVLARCLDDDADAVVSVGGGAVISAANRARLASAGTVVWLRATPATLSARVGDGAGRPLLAGGPEAAARRLAELARERAPFYAEVADAVLDVDGCTPDEVARRVVAARGVKAHGGVA